ncbi:MAG: SGNH/GDSL hydrolase family protein [Acetatifactor sp.]|nr:SGNH/GDSL hydrolase family protein [Acetatifactor sp.]
MAEEKRKSTKTVKVIYGFCGIVIILALLPWLLGSMHRGDIQAEVLFLGDSIVGQYRDDSSIPVLVAKQLGTTVENGAFGGTTMSLQNRENRDAYYRDGLSFSQLARAIAAQDFGTQQTIRTKDYVTANFGSIVDELDTVDYSSIKTLVITYGMNDYTTGSPISNPLEPEDPGTMEGAMRTGINLLRQAYPELRIIFMSPTYCWFVNTLGTTNETCETNDYGGGYLEEYVEAQRRVAAECGVEFLDIFHDFYPHEQYQEWRIYTEDGMHPNEAGRQMIAQALAEHIQKNE